MFRSVHERQLFSFGSAWVGKRLVLNLEWGVGLLSGPEAAARLASHCGD
jgi:hypothetical protein